LSGNLSSGVLRSSAAAPAGASPRRTEWTTPTAAPASFHRCSKLPAGAFVTYFCAGVAPGTMLTFGAGSPILDSLIGTKATVTASRACEFLEDEIALVLRQALYGRLRREQLLVAPPDLEVERRGSGGLLSASAESHSQTRSPNWTWLLVPESDLRFLSHPRAGFRKPQAPVGPARRHGEKVRGIAAAEIIGGGGRSLRDRPDPGREQITPSPRGRGIRFPLWAPRR